MNYYKKKRLEAKALVKFQKREEMVYRPQGEGWRE